jgi:hypothetical protein
MPRVARHSHWMLNCMAKRRLRCDHVADVSSCLPGIRQDLFWKNSAYDVVLAAHQWWSTISGRRPVCSPRMFSGVGGCHHALKKTGGPPTRAKFLQYAAQKRRKRRLKTSGIGKENEPGPIYECLHLSVYRLIQSAALRWRDCVSYSRW